MRHVAVVLAAALTLAGCARFTAAVDRVDAFTAKYAPIVGRTLIKIGAIVVRAECSPALSPASQAVANTLHLVAPTSSAANQVSQALQVNMDVAAQLCPLVEEVVATVGHVPAGTPSQVVSLPGGK